MMLQGAVRVFFFLFTVLRHDVVAGNDDPPSATKDNPPSRQRRHLIVGGQPADPGRFPYHVRLDYEQQFGCGGTLVRRDMVLTAAHCAFEEDVGILTATVGAYNHHQLDTHDNNHTKLVRAIIRHPAYHDNSDINDIALLKIDPVDDVSIPLVQLNTDRAIPAVGDSVTTIGLGLTSEGGVDADVLQEVELKIVSDKLCDERYEGYLHRKSMICAADPNQDSCDGDSGGMLAILGDTPADDVQVGVVSFGDECAHESIPGVHADVSYVYGWIESTLCQHSVDPPVGCKNATTSFIIGEGEECRDYPGAFYAGWWHQFQRCEWLHGRVGDYCYKSNEAWVQCPFTCHSCTYQEDDEFYDDDDYANYNESSSPLVLGMLLAVSFVFCCTICFWSFRCLRQSNGQSQLHGAGGAANKERSLNDAQAIPVVMDESATPSYS